MGKDLDQAGVELAEDRGDAAHRGEPAGAWINQAQSASGPFGSENPAIGQESETGECLKPGRDHLDHEPRIAGGEGAKSGARSFVLGFGALAREQGKQPGKGDLTCPPPQARLGFSISTRVVSRFSSAMIC